MTTTTLANIVIFVSAYAPLYLLLALRSLESSERSAFVVAVAVGLCVIAAASVLALRKMTRTLRGKFEVKILRATNKSSEIVNYTIPYMISFVAFNVSSAIDMFSLVVFMIMLYELSVSTQSIFMNPIMAARGWGLFDVDFEENGVKKSGVFLTALPPEVDGWFSMRPLSPYLSVLVEKKR